MSLDLYSMEASPPCRSVLMTAKALNVELNVIPASPRTGATKTPEFLAINPQHCIPTLHDTKTGFSLWESRAIITYLVNKYAPGHALYPTDPEKRATIDARLNFDIGTLYSNIAKTFYPMMRGAQAAPEDLKTLDEKLALLNGFLADGYVAGKSVTLADFSVYSSLIYLVALGIHDLTPFKNITDWFQKMTVDYEQKEANERSLVAITEILAAVKAEAANAAKQ